MTIQRLSHIGLCVTDLERSLKFYRDELGFRFVSEIRIAGELVSTLLDLAAVDLHAVYLERDGFRLELLHYHTPTHGGGASEPRPLNQPGLTHLSLRVADLDPLVDHLRSRGVRVREHTHIKIPGAQAAAVFVADPDGTLIELVESPGDPGRLPGE